MADGSKVAFIGLGVMGHPMAGYLASNGHTVTVYNRTTSKADAWDTSSLIHLLAND